MKESTFQSAAIGVAPPKFVRGNSANLFAKVKFKSYVCAVFYTAWRVRLVVAGIFMPLIYGFVPPCGALMRLLPFVGVGQRVGMKPFLFTYCFTF